MISEAFGAIGDAFGRKSHAPKRPKMRRLCAIRALRFFATTKNRKFLIAVWGPKNGLRRATGPLRGCNERPVRLQRSARCIAGRAPLQSREGAAGPHPGPPQGEGELTLFIND